MRRAETPLAVNQGSNVKVFLRKNDQEEYVGPDESWVGDRAAAVDFKSAMVALDYFLAAGLQHVNIVLSWGNPDLDIVYSPEHVKSYPVAPRRQRSD